MRNHRWEGLKVWGNGSTALGCCWQPWNNEGLYNNWRLYTGVCMEVPLNIRSCNILGQSGQEANWNSVRKHTLLKLMQILFSTVEPETGTACLATSRVFRIHEHSWDWLAILYLKICVTYSLSCSYDPFLHTFSTWILCLLPSLCSYCTFCCMQGLLRDQHSVLKRLPCWN